MRLVTFGVGYVGLVTGTGLSELGHEVLCVDIDEQRVIDLRKGKIPIYEPGLSDLVRRNVQSRRLSFATKVDAPFDEADLYFIAVGTPPGKDGAADLSAVMAVAEKLTQVVKKPALVAMKSTVPVGTCDKVQALLDKSSIQLEVVGAKGGPEVWGVEMNSPNNLVKQGWKSTILKGGDKVSVVINPLRTGEHGGAFVSIKLPDGRVLGGRQTD